MNVLHICANPKPTEISTTKQMAAAFFSNLVEKNMDVEMHNLDLYQDSPPFLSYEAFRAIWAHFYEEDYEPTDREIKAVKYATRHADMLNKADILVLTTPMWNFSIPAILKAWIDQVIAPGLTYNLNDDGSIEPLHKLKRVVLLVASAETYKEDDPRDALTAVLRNAFHYIGVNDVEIAWADCQDPKRFEDHEQHKEWAMDMAIELAEDVAELEISSD